MLEVVRTLCSVASVAVLCVILVVAHKTMKKQQEPPSVVFYGMDSFKEHLKTNPMDCVKMQDPQFNRNDYNEEDEEDE